MTTGKDPNLEFWITFLGFEDVTSRRSCEARNFFIYTRKSYANNSNHLKGSRFWIPASALHTLYLVWSLQQHYLLRSLPYRWTRRKSQSWWVWDLDSKQVALPSTGPICQDNDANICRALYFLPTLQTSPDLLRAFTPLSTPRGWGVLHVVASPLPHPQDPRVSSPNPPGPPGGAELRLPHQVAGQLLPQLDTAAQRRLTEGTVQEDLVRLANSKIIAEEAEMLLGMFLPRNLHAWVTGTETWVGRRRLPHRLLLPEVKPLCPRKQTPPICWACPWLRHAQASARFIHSARAFRCVPSGQCLRLERFCACSLPFRDWQYNDNENIEP